MNDKLRNQILAISAIIILASTILHATIWSETFYTTYFFAIGAIGMVIARITRRYEGKNLRLKRLYRMETLSSLLIVGTSYLMFDKTKYGNDWVLLLTIAAFLQLYAAFFIPKAIEKDGK